MVTQLENNWNRANGNLPKALYGWHDSACELAKCKKVDQEFEG